MPRPRTVTPELPSETGVRDGLSYSLWLPSTTAAVLRSPRSRLIAPPGGHHQSIQHDAEMQAVSLRFIELALADAADLGSAQDGLR